jgi:hypothetical protein
MNTTHYYYHFCAEWVNTPGIVQRFDGIARMEFQVLTMDDYRQLKNCIQQAGKDTPKDSAQITILSLSLIGKREVKGGKR